MAQPVDTSSTSELVGMTIPATGLPNEQAAQHLLGLAANLAPEQNANGTPKDSAPSTVAPAFGTTPAPKSDFAVSSTVSSGDPATTTLVTGALVLPPTPSAAQAQPGPVAEKKKAAPKVRSVGPASMVAPEVTAKAAAAAFEFSDQDFAAGTHDNLDGFALGSPLPMIAPQHSVDLVNEAGLAAVDAPLEGLVTAQLVSEARRLEAFLVSTGAPSPRELVVVLGKNAAIGRTFDDLPTTEMAVLTWLRLGGRTWIAYTLSLSPDMILAGIHYILACVKDMVDTNTAEELKDTLVFAPVYGDAKIGAKRSTYWPRHLLLLNTSVTSNETVVTPFEPMLVKLVLALMLDSPTTNASPLVGAICGKQHAKTTPQTASFCEWLAWHCSHLPFNILDLQLAMNTPGYRLRSSTVTGSDLTGLSGIGALLDAAETAGEDARNAVKAVLKEHGFGQHVLRAMDDLIAFRASEPERRSTTKPSKMPKTNLPASWNRLFLPLVQVLQCFSPVLRTAEGTYDQVMDPAKAALLEAFTAGKTCEWFVAYVGSPRDFGRMLTRDSGCVLTVAVGLTTLRNPNGTPKYSWGQLTGDLLLAGQANKAMGFYVAAAMLQWAPLGNAKTRSTTKQQQAAVQSMVDDADFELEASIHADAMRRDAKRRVHRIDGTHKRYKALPDDDDSDGEAYAQSRKQGKRAAQAVHPETAVVHSELPVVHDKDAAKRKKLAERRQRQAQASASTDLAVPSTGAAPSGAVGIPESQLARLNPTELGNALGESICHQSFALMAKAFSDATEANSRARIAACEARKAAE